MIFEFEAFEVNARCNAHKARYKRAGQKRPHLLPQTLSMPLTFATAELTPSSLLSSRSRSIQFSRFEGILRAQQCTFEIICRSPHLGYG
jgi:hypothetical protein